MEHFADEVDDHKSKSKERKIFFKTLDYVNGHFTEPINVNFLASELFYSRGRLSAIFTKYSGTRLGDYISALRIQRVNELISSGVSITEAAFSSGFQNIRSFNNVYKDVMGISPSEYVKGKN
jgi:two-component system response regulator YesN